MFHIPLVALGQIYTNVVIWDLIASSAIFSPHHHKFIDGERETTKPNM
jgi:hypothetical protein